jgi:hypothetical protein
MAFHCYNSRNYRNSKPSSVINLIEQIKLDEWPDMFRPLDAILRGKTVIGN